MRPYVFGIECGRDRSRQQPGPVRHGGNVTAHLAEARRGAMIEAIHVLQPRCGARNPFTECEIRSQVREPRQLGAFFTGWWLVYILPQENVAGRLAKLGPRHRIDGEPGSKKQEIRFKCRVVRERDVHRAFPLFGGDDRLSEMEVRVLVAADAQDRFMGRRCLRGGRILHETPAPLTGQLGKSAGEAVASNPHQLVDRRHLLAPYEMPDLGCTVFQGFTGIVHGRRSHTDDRHALAAKGCKVDFAAAVRPEVIRQVLHETGDVGLTHTIATGREDDLAGNHGARRPTRKAETQQVALGLHPVDGHTVLHWNAQDAAVPAQVIHPHPSRDLAEPVPGQGPELCAIPRLKRQRAETTGRAGQLLGRTQCFHARIRDPRSFHPLGASVEYPQVRHAAHRQGEPRGHSAHSAADDDDIGDARRGRHPGLARIAEEFQILPQPRFQSREALRIDSGQAVFRHVGHSGRGPLQTS